MEFKVILFLGLVILQGIQYCSSLIYRTYWFCEHSGAHVLKCSGSQEQFINVTNAMYGRLRTDVCNSGSSVTNCQSPLSTRVVARQCHGLNTCKVEATNAFFGDPCVSVQKYLEVRFSCLHGDTYPEIEKLQDGYVYSNQVPNQAVLHMYSKSSDLAVGPYYFTIYKTTEIASDAQYNKTIYQDALNFLQTQIKSPTIAQGAVCKPNLNDPASKFCVHTDLGYIFTSATFIPGMYPGKAYELGIVVRDHSSTVPVVRKTTQRISVVPACFPMTELYKSVKTSCPHDAQKGTFPPGYSWSNLYYTKILMYVVPPVVIARVYFDINLLADFQRDSSYWTYNITLTISGVEHKRAFTYIPVGLDKLFNHDKPTVSGFNFNVTVEPPIEVATAKNVYVELKLINSGRTTAVKFNSPNAVYLYGTRKLTTCPGSACMAAYYTWVDGISMLKTSQNSDCIEDHYLQEIYLKPCDKSLKVILPKSILFSKPFNLTCERSTRFDTLIIWYKDDTLLTKTGQNLAIDGKDYASQGYYRCETSIDGVIFSSEKALVVFEDVSTTSTYLQITNEVFSSDLENRNSVAFQLLSNDIISAVKTILTGLSSKGQHYVEIEKFTKGSVVAQVIIAGQKESGVDMDAYYNQMTKLLSDAAAQNKFGRFQIPASSIVIASKEYCIQETSNVQASKGPYKWPMTKIGQNATVACPNGPAGSNATRACRGSFVNGARWADVSDSPCAFNNKISEELNQLAEVTVNDTNAESTATALEKLTKNATSFTADDTLFAATTFVKLVTVNVTTDKIVEDILETASNLLQANESALATSQAQGKALSSIVQGIETLADKIPLPNTTGTPVVRVSSGVAIQALKIDKSSKTPLNFGMRNASFSLNNVVSNQDYDSKQVQVGLSLPETLARDINTTGEPRISFIAYKGSQFFQTTKTDFRGKRNVDRSPIPNSMVISAHVKGSKRINLSNNLTGTFKKISPSQADKCVFWDFAKNDGYGAWSSEGCHQKNVISGRVICECDHMTNFAILFDVYAGKKTVEDETHEQILGIISFIGIGLSLGGLFLVLLTLAMFSRLRRNLPSRILINLCLALMLTLICFVAGADRTEPVYVCRGFAVAIQYFLLASFCWMSVESVNLYLSFVVVMGSYITKFTRKAAIFAWGLPAVIVAVTASLRIQDYGNERYCVVTGWAAYGTMFAPICLIVIVNIGVFIRVFYALQSSAKGKTITKDQKRTGISQLRIAATFSCILGLTWIFGIFAIADARIFFQYLFCIFNSLQGFMIFYLHVARQQEARKHWIFFLTGKGLNYHRATMSSSTARTMRTKQGETYRLRTPSTDKNGTLTSTLGRSNEYSNTSFRPSQSEA